MFSSLFKPALLIALTALSTGAAHATTITFEDLAPARSGVSYSNTFSPVPGYTFQLGAAASAFVVDSATYVGTSIYAFNGTDYLRLRATTTLTSAASPLFSVKSIDLANGIYDAVNTNFVGVILTGTYADSKSITTIYQMNNNNNTVTTNDFTTELLTGFTNLKSFRIQSTGYLGVDNIVIDPAATDVPEPASLAILALGLVGIAVIRRRKSA
jgi:hypothetical protein